MIQEQGVPYNTSRLHGIRIKHLPTGTVQFETLMASNIEGMRNKMSKQIYSYNFIRFRFRFT